LQVAIAIGIGLVALTITSSLVGLALPSLLLSQPVLAERDLRVRSHAGALSRFYLDGLLGLVAIRAHGAERAVRREHENLLSEWARAGYGLQRSAVFIEGVQLLCGYGLAAWMLVEHLTRTADAGGVLLLVYWALNLPVLGEQIAQVAWQYPAYRNVTLRLLEPLGALDEAEPEAVSWQREPTHTGAALAFENVAVVAAGHTILEDIQATIASGSHVAIVGPSGAGKSTLVGLLLGWHRPAAGSLLVDNVPLEGAHLERLRCQTAWVDPAVQLWNRTFLDNLQYGADSASAAALGLAIESADLRSVLEKLPDGLQTHLGEGGALVSGGEGQRVRLGRALIRQNVRLVILDEPFRGLDREKRRDLLARARQLWRRATVLCITHDVGETQSFERVIVIDGGHIVEDGAPADLLRQPGSRYRSLLQAEEAVARDLWSKGEWRHWWLEGGTLEERRHREGRAV
jgi:ATP-binding cassette subfamily B protein